MCTPFEVSVNDDSEKFSGVDCGDLSVVVLFILSVVGLVHE